ncbi:MAG: PP2C family serine/threonine-protein phosphatase [Candidatus Andersenbacteria bacterium]
MITRQTTISLCSEKGARTAQEDSYGVFRVGDWECFAVADGYGKALAAEPSISSEVISYLLEATTFAFKEGQSLDAINCEQFFATIFDFIDGQTHHFMNGSTLAVAFHNRKTPAFHTAVLGDSLAIHLSPSAIKTNPNEHLHLENDQLWGSFGDRYHAHLHEKHPECHTFTLKQSEALLLCSDGLFSSHNPEAIQAQANEYTSWILDEHKDADYLVHYAQQEKPAHDNATAIVIRI